MAVNGQCGDRAERQSPCTPTFEEGTQISDPEQIIDLADSLSRWCQEQIGGSQITFRVDELEWSAEGAFAPHALLPMFLHMAIFLSPEGPELQMLQCRNLAYVFEVQAVIPARLHSHVEENWKVRLQQIIATYKAEAGALPAIINVIDPFYDFAICSSWNDVPTFDSVEAAMEHYKSRPEDQDD